MRNDETNPWQVMPDIDAEDYRELRDDIARRGVLVPIEYDEQGNVLDGHHRLRACQELGITEWPRVVRGGMSDDEKLDHVLSLNLDRRHLTREQRRELVQRLRNAQWSERRIAEKLVVSPSTVHLDLAGARNRAPRCVIGSDSKRYPAKAPERPSPPASIFAKDDREAASAARILKQGAQLEGTHTVTSARKLAYQQRCEEARTRVAERGEQSVLPDTVTIHTGDFRELMRQMEPDSVDLIFTDPPYDAESVALYGDLAELGARVLRPGGSLIAYVGGYAYMEAGRLMCPHLTWWWPLSIRYHGATRRLPGRFIFVETKPLLWYVKGNKRLTDSLVTDGFDSEGKPEKALHEWEQGYAEAEYYIRHLCAPGGTVLDPMCGSGTTLLAAMRNGFRAVGIEIDEQRAAVARGRIAEAIERDAKAAQPGENGNE